MPPMLNRLRILGLIEGSSTLLLFFVALPLKYLADMPLAVKIVGSLHGALFVAYVLLLAFVVWRARWPLWRGALLFVAAVIPFGPFIMDPRIKHWAAQDAAPAADPDLAAAT
jgi:integral membrane protein